MITATPFLIHWQLSGNFLKLSFPFVLAFSIFFFLRHSLITPISHLFCSRSRLQETKFSNSKTIPMPPGPSACKEKLSMPQSQQQIATIEQPPKGATNGTTEQQVPGTSAAISIPVRN